MKASSYLHNKSRKYWALENVNTCIQSFVKTTAQGNMTYLWSLNCHKKQQFLSFSYVIMEKGST